MLAIFGSLCRSRHAHSPNPEFAKRRGDVADSATFKELELYRFKINLDKVQIFS
jgi:hypothetical protein